MTGHDSSFRVYHRHARARRRAARRRLVGERGMRASVSARASRVSLAPPRAFASAAREAWARRRRSGVRVDLVGEEEDATVLIRDMAACEGAIERGGWDAGAIERVVRAPRAQRAIAGAWDETRGGELVGYAVCVGDGTLVATIERVCVREDMRGRGIGRGLVHALGEKMFEREIYDVGVRAPEALVGFFDSLNYDDDDSVCMRFEATVEEGAHISS